MSVVAEASQCSEAKLTAGRKQDDEVTSIKPGNRWLNRKPYTQMNSVSNTIIWPINDAGIRREQAFQSPLANHEPQSVRNRQTSRDAARAQAGAA